MAADHGRPLTEQRTATLVPEVAGLARELVGMWGCWAPTLMPDGSCVAFVSDRRGTPELYVQDMSPGAAARRIALSADPVVSVEWSPDGSWLACSVATSGGVRTEVWIVRPDGADARRVAGGDVHAVLGPWARGGHALVVTICSDDPYAPHECVALDSASGAGEVVAVGELIDMLDLTSDARFALLRDGTRGAQFCRLVDRRADSDYPVLPYAETGSTDVGLLRPAPPGDAARFVAYLVTDAGLPRRALIAAGVAADGTRIAGGVLAAREDAELELADADDAGATLVLVWNIDGGSEVQLLDTAANTLRDCPGLPGAMVTSVAMARDGSCAVLTVESPTAPRALWRLDVVDGSWSPVTEPGVSRFPLVEPELLRFDSHDGLPITGWFYRSPAATAAAMISLHGGPEAQERPSFNPQHQVLAAAGISVLAPNIRGSSGFGRTFVHADDRYGRIDAISDVAECARVLVARGGADASRIAVGGRSYGGYATLMALTRYAPLFAAGVDICGMSDLRTFYRDTEPWIAAAAVTKYGDPVADATLLAELSPLHQARKIVVPLLVVHGELDTNVPIGEAKQIVTRLRKLGRPVEYLELAGEGHEYRRADSRLLLIARLVEFLTSTLVERPIG